jgi:ATP-dependent protease ClpP protease subunit
MAYNTYKFNARNEDDDEDDDGQMKSFLLPQKKRYQQYNHTYTAQHVHFYLSEDVGAPAEYTDMIHRISAASENDTIFIHLNTPGGRLDTGVQIINAMQNSEAKIVTVLEAEAFSLGTLIFLAGDELIVNDHCMIMFHNFKGGVSGKGHEQLAQLDATIKWFTAIAREVYIPFLSEEEFNRIIKGEDLYMHSTEIRARIDNMIAEYERQAEEEEKAAMRELKAAEKAQKSADRAEKTAQTVQKTARKKIDPVILTEADPEIEPAA